MRISPFDSVGTVMSPMRTALRPVKAPHAVSPLALEARSSIVEAPWATRRASADRLGKKPSPTTKTSGTVRTTWSMSGSQLVEPTPCEASSRIGRGATTVEKVGSAGRGSSPETAKPDFGRTCGPSPWTRIAPVTALVAASAAARTASLGTPSSMARSSARRAGVSGRDATISSGEERSGSAITRSIATAAAPAAAVASISSASRLRGHGHWP